MQFSGIEKKEWPVYRPLKVISTDFAVAEDPGNFFVPVRDTQQLEQLLSEKVNNGDYKYKRSGEQQDPGDNTNGRGPCPGGKIVLHKVLPHKVVPENFVGIDNVNRKRGGSGKGDDFLPERLEPESGKQHHMQETGSQIKRRDQGMGNHKTEVIYLERPDIPFRSKIKENKIDQKDPQQCGKGGDFAANAGLFHDSAKQIQHHQPDDGITLAHVKGLCDIFDQYQNAQKQKQPFQIMVRRMAQQPVEKRR